MIAVHQAQRLVLGSARVAPATNVSLGDALGLVLAVDVVSDLDLPPFDKSLMDGFAVRSADLAGGRGELQVVARIVAGEMPQSQGIAAGQAAQIMTGAPVPPGADTVVAVERTSRGAGDRGQESGVSGQWSVVIDDSRLMPGQNIMRRGTELTRGQVVLRAGTRLRPAEVGVLAAVGGACASVFPRPRVAVVSTGNEIVEASETPEPGQIRNSNGPTIAALVARAGGAPRYLGIARDADDDLRRLVRDGLNADILVLSGGVSAGELDLVPGVLRELGVCEVFHKVDLKPGKPVWFGVLDSGARNTESGLNDRTESDPTLRPPRSALVFGLPGNPVSVMVCFELFVRPAIRQLMGMAPAVEPLLTAKITEAKNYRSDRPTYWPAWLEFGGAGATVRPVAWLGSPDLRATTDANAFIYFSSGEHALQPGDQVPVLSCDW
jgi:molybdopterin molybdotransferase